MADGDIPVITPPVEQTPMQTVVAGQAMAMYAVGSPLPGVLSLAGSAESSQKMVAAGLLPESPFATKDGDKAQVAKNVTLAFTTDKNEANLRIGADGKFETKSGNNASIWHKDLDLSGNNPVCKIYLDKGADQAKVLETLKAFPDQLNRYATEATNPIKTAVSGLPNTVNELQKAIQSGHAAPGSKTDSTAELPENERDVQTGTTGGKPTESGEIPATTTPETKKSDDGATDPSDKKASEGSQKGPVKGASKGGGGGSGGGGSSGGGGGDGGCGPGGCNPSETGDSTGGDGGTGGVGGDGSTGGVGGNAVDMNRIPWGARETASQAVSRDVIHPLNYAHYARRLYTPQWQARHAALYKSLDANNDGVVSPEELANATEAQKAEQKSLDGEIDEKVNSLAQQDPDSRESLQSFAQQMKDFSPASIQFHDNLNKLGAFTDQVDQSLAQNPQALTAVAMDQLKAAFTPLVNSVFSGNQSQLDGLKGATARFIVNKLPESEDKNKIPEAAVIRGYRDPIKSDPENKYQGPREKVLNYMTNKLFNFAP